MIVKALREGLGRVIILIDFISRPKPLQRSEEEQAAVNRAAEGMALYQFYACPFCVKARRAIRRLNLPIETRNAQHDMQHRRTLENEGGEIKVPCLRIDEGGSTRWVYDSSEIIDYLNQRFDPSTAAVTR